MTNGNQDQIAYWNSEVGQRWAAQQRDLDAVFAPLTAALFEATALQTGSRLLDVGCGAGETALIAARALGPGGSVVAADVSRPMLDAARGRTTAASAAPITWIEADAESHDFGAARFDHVLSRFGVMFFANSEGAFANLRRALVSGGRLTFLCWRALDQNPWAAMPRDIVRTLIPDFEPPPLDAPGPFRFADGDALRATLESAGFAEIGITPVRRALTLGASAEPAARFSAEMGPAARMLRDRDEATKAKAFRVLAATFAQRFEGRPVVLDAGCWLVSATN